MQNLSADYRVYAPDLLGFGQTDKVVFLDRSAYESRVHQIAAFCFAIGIRQRTHFVGTSFGGSLVLRAAASNAWPIATATSFGGTGGGLWRLQRGFEVLNTFAPGKGYIEEVTRMLVNDASGFSKHVELRYANTLIPGHYASMVAARLKHPEAVTVNRIESYPRSLSGVKGVSVVEMSDDQIVEAGWTSKLTALVPNLTAHRMSGPHSPNLSHPEEVSALLREIFSDADQHDKFGSDSSPL
jgi:pimeloyl-ACP methyl ester carboxylesterase